MDTINSIRFNIKFGRNGENGSDNICGRIYKFVLLGLFLFPSSIELHCGLCCYGHLICGI